MVIPKINSAHGSDTRNILNRAIDLINTQGKFIQDLVAEGQLTPEQYAELISIVNGHIKSGDIKLADLHTEVKKALTGGAVPVVGRNSIGKENIKRRNVSVGHLDFASETENLFDGLYVDGLIFTTIVDGERHFIPVYNFDDLKGKTAVVPILKNKTYSIKIHDPDQFDYLRIGISQNLVDFQQKGDDLAAGYPIPDSYTTLDEVLLNVPGTTYKTFVFDSTQQGYLYVALSNSGKEPRLKIEEGDTPTDYTPGRMISRDYLQSPIVGIGDLQENILTDSDNLFSGEYELGVLYYVVSEKRYVPLKNGALYDGRTAVIPINPDKTYNIKIHDIDESRGLRVGIVDEYMQFQDDQGGLHPGEPIPDNYDSIPEAIDHYERAMEATIKNSSTGKFLYINVTAEGQEPRLQVVEGDRSGPYKHPKVISQSYIEDVTAEQNENYSYDPIVAKNKFCEALNDKANQIGMTNTNLVEPAGFPSTVEHQMSPRDMLKMTVQASGYKDLAMVWNKKSYTFNVGGPNKREISISTTVSSSLIENEFYIFGGKTGSVGSVEELRGSHLVLVTDAPDERQFVATIRGASDNSQRYIQMKRLLDNAKALIENPEAAVDALEAGGAVALIPQYNPFSYEQYDFPLIYENDADVPGHPASTTKVMSAILLLDHIQDLDQHVTIDETDIQPGTGPTFYAGDIMTIRDALYCMMLPSSNTATHAVARVVGNKLMKRDDL